MKGKVLVVLASLWLVSGYTLASEPALPPVSAFARVPAMESVVLSPGGQRIAWVDNSGTRPVVQVLDLAKVTQVKRVDVPDPLHVHGLDWADDETLLIHQLAKPADRSIESPAHEWLDTAAMQVTTGKMRELLKYTSRFGVNGKRLLALHPSKPRTVILSSWTSEGYLPDGKHTVRGNNFDEGHDLYEVDTLTGEAQVVGWGTPFTIDWVVGADGQAVARGEWFPRPRLYKVLHRRGVDWVEILRLETGERPTLLGLSRDGAAVLMGATLGRKHVGVWQVPLHGSGPTLALGDESSDITRLLRDPYSQEVLGGWTAGLTPELRWLNKQAENRAISLRKTFGGKSVIVISRSADDRRAVVSVGSRSTPATYYLVDFERGTADTVGEEYPALVGVPLGEARPVTFKARDGYDVQAYLTLPPGREAEKLPLVILDYTWYAGRERTIFDPMAQFLASRGYAVLQPQERKIGAGPVQDDITAGVRAMVAQGIAEPRRVCVVDYGGYVALAGAAFTPELYACAISMNGVANFSDLIKNHRESGSEPSLPESLKAASNVRVPILLMHDVDNSLVPLEQARKTFETLGGQPPHQFIELPGEGTWPLRRETWIRALTEMERFVAKHLAPKEEP